MNVGEVWLFTSQTGLENVGRIDIRTNRPCIIDWNPHNGLIWNVRYRTPSGKSWSRADVPINRKYLIPFTEQAEDDMSTITNNLAPKHFPELYRDDFYTVSVKFLNNDIASGTEYTYKVPNELSVKVDEKLLVWVDDVGKAVKVTKMHERNEIDTEASFRYKWVVGRMDEVMAMHNANVKRDEDIARGLKILKAALDRVETRTRLEAAFNLLGDKDRAEIGALFGKDFAIGHDAPKDK